MFTDNERNQFEDWQKKWDAASEQMSKDYANEMAKKGQKKAEQPSTSWLTNTPMEKDYKDNNQIDSDPMWRDIFYRSQQISGGLITEDQITEDQVKYSDGEKKPDASFGGFTPTKTNPTTQSSVGPDGGVRVTKNWSDSEDLRELDDIKRRVEQMERKHHEAEVQSEKSAGGLKKQLESLRDRIHKLSEKINREPEVDVT